MFRFGLLLHRLLFRLAAYALAKYHFIREAVVLEDEMGGACGAHGEGEGCIQHFGWKA
jgi:hypothetical protein